MKYIDAEKLIAQIERLKVGARIQGFNSDYVYALDEVLSFIPFIQQEQPQVADASKMEQPEVSARHGWVARDMNNDLHYFSVKPVRSGAKWWDRDYLSMEVDGSLFGGLTWEDEPIEVELFIRELGLIARKEE